MPFNAESITSIIKDGIPALEILAGSKAAAMFIEKVSGALGWYTEPKQIIRKARAEAAASLIKAEADQAVKSLSERAVARIIHEETKHQQNMESITLGALPAISEDAKPNDIDDDWLSNFFNKGRHISNEEMQKLWSQILAGEANQPGAFSLRTLDALSKLNKTDAEVFKRLCAFIWTDDKNHIFVIAPSGIVTNEGSTQLSGNEIYHLTETNLTLLVFENEVNINSENMIITYYNRSFKITAVDAFGNASHSIKELPIGYMKLTQIGLELSRICQGEPDWSYMDKVIDRFNHLGFKTDEVLQGA